MDQFWTWGDDFSVKFRSILLVLKHFQYSKQAHSGPENLKQSRPKKNSKNKINQFQEIFMDQYPFFAISKMARNHFVN